MIRILVVLWIGLEAAQSFEASIAVACPPIRTIPHPRTSSTARFFSKTQEFLHHDELTEPGFNRYFTRDKVVLEQATAVFLDSPRGALKADDLPVMAHLMEAWSQREWRDAAFVVDQLVKRIVDELRHGNNQVQMSAQLYTYVCADVYRLSNVTSHISCTGD